MINFILEANRTRISDLAESPAKNRPHVREFGGIYLPSQCDLEASAASSAHSFLKTHLHAPRASGGLYNFLRNGFGERIAFILGWTSTLVTKPFAAAGDAIRLRHALQVT